MRHHGPPSEIRRLTEPLRRLADAVWGGTHWWIITMAVLYAVSGVTVVRQDEVALVLRWGHIVGDTPALQQHGPGLFFAWPRPIDDVIHVPIKRVSEVRVTTLVQEGIRPLFLPEKGEPTNAAMEGLDPVVDGYALTGDHNVVQLVMVARYRIRDPAEWQFHGPEPEDILRTEVTAAMVRSVGEMNVDRVLSDGRKALIATATARAQAGLDAARSGLELTSLEVTQLSPPARLAADFAAVQSAFIAAETKKKEAQAFAATAIPDATAQANAAVQSARAAADLELAQARGDGTAFRALAREYHANPPVVRERLYRDAIERAITPSNVRWVPPPVGGRYQGLRITIGSP